MVPVGAPTIQLAWDSPGLSPGSPHPKKFLIPSKLGQLVTLPVSGTLQFIRRNGQFKIYNIRQNGITAVIVGWFRF